MNIETFDSIEQSGIFDPNKSELEADSEVAQRYAQLLEDEIGHDFKVAGIIEIGSFAKGEAVPGSDIDTRVYLSSPDCYLWQISGSRISTAKQEESEQNYTEFTKGRPAKPRLTLDWFEFNDHASKRLSSKLGMNLEFGLADQRFADFELANLASQPSAEHQMILQSNIIYDPDGWLAGIKSKIEGAKFPAQESFYQERYLNALPFEIYTHLQPHTMDQGKLEKSRQIPWVKWAVRALRDAIGTKTYIQTGHFIYKKEEILRFCHDNLSSKDFGLASELYRWKTDPEVREKMVHDYLSNPDPLFQLFSDRTKGLERVVETIRRLPDPPDSN